MGGGAGVVVGVCGDGVVSLAVWSGGGSAGLGVREAGENFQRSKDIFLVKSEQNLFWDELWVFIELPPPSPPY